MKFNTQELTRLVEAETTDEAKILAAAVYYTGCKIPIVPLSPGEKALPPKRTGMNYQSATTTQKTAQKWFEPGGKWQGWSIGIACGRPGGVCVVDIDLPKPGKDADGRITWAELCEKNDGWNEDTPVQTSPSGGRHLLFEWVEGMGSTGGKLGPGVDTRGGSISQYVSHIVAYPSPMPNGEYRWVERPEMDLIPAPDWVAKIVGRVDHDMETQSTDMETQVSLEQIERMITFIPASVNHEEWVKVGMAIHSQYPGIEGMEVWDTWSKTTTVPNQYNRSTLKLKWLSFKKSGRIRIGSLFHFAREHGWEATDEDQVKEVRNMSLEMLNETHSLVMVGGKARVVKDVPPPDKVMPHYVVMATDDFKMMMCNRFITIGDNDKPRRLADVWLNWKFRNTHPAGMGMFPNGAPPGWYNTWNGFAYKPIEGDWSKLHDHVVEVICEGNEDWANWTFDWMADAIQHPENPPGTAIVMRGDEGVGKGTLADKFGRLFGYHYRHLNNDAHLTGNFNAHMMDALFVFADEITWGGNRKTAGVLKGLVTEKHLLGERKNVDAISYRNMVRLMIASNSDWVVPADISSRRWFVLDIPNTKREDFKYFAAIEDEFNGGGAEAMMYFLTKRDIKSELRKAPETGALGSQRTQSLPTCYQWWASCIELENLGDSVISQDKEWSQPEKGDTSNWPTTVLRSSIHIAYESWCLHRNLHAMGHSTFYMHMKKMGIKDTRPTNEDGKRTRNWVIPEYEEAVAIFANKLGIKSEDLM